MAKPVKEAQIQGSGELISKIVCQIAAILVLSFALGLAFNASNPIGIPWSGTSPKTEPPPAQRTPARLSANTNSASQSQVTVASQTNNTVSPPAQVTSPNGLRPDAYSVATIRPTDKQSQVIWSGTSATTNAPPPTTNSTNVAAPTPPVLRYAAATTWAQTKPRVAAGKVVLVDARPKPVYDAGHIPSALSLPETSTPEEFKAFQEQYGTNAPVVVYCSSTSCSLSAKVANKLVQQYGFATVEFMTGGYQEWQQAELSQNKTNTNDQAVKP